MKNFVKHILAIAICAAALLSSCIKEQPYELKIAQLEVAVTRADASSSQEQGDGIGNAMFWVFKCSDLNADGAPTAVPNEYAASWRVMHTVNQSQSMTVHMELPLCDTDHQDYILVAILNTDAFGNTIKLDQYTKFADLQQALFDASNAEFWNEYPVDEEGNRAPWKMPISNWKTFTVTNDNTHPSKCYKLNLPVYRAVAKTQLFVKPKSNNFTVTVTDATVHSVGMPIKGAILTANTASNLDNNTINSVAVKSQQGNAGENVTSPVIYPDTFPYGTSAGTRQLYNTVTTDGNNDFADVAVSSTTDTWAGSTFIYENAKVLSNTEDYKTVPTGNQGYYMQISYQVSGDTTPHTRYVALPAVVRNHDYQVKATVDAGGKLTFWIEVNQWNVEEEEINYQDIATLSENGHIMWLGSTLKDAPTGITLDITHKDSYKPLPNGETINDLGQVTATATILGAERAGVINLTAAQNASATFKFELDTPVGGTWIAELRTIGNGDTGDIVFGSVNGTNLWTTGADNTPVFNTDAAAEGGPLVTATPTYIEGNIDNQSNVITIKNLVYNSASKSDPVNIVELHIYAKAYWGTVLRSYRVDGIVGSGVTYQFYTLWQPQGV